MEIERIDITNPILNIQPTKRFAEIMNVEEDFWEDMYYRYSTLEYSKLDLKEWFEFKTKRPIAYKTIDRWVKRQELFNDIRDIRRKGVKQVTIQFFTRNLNEAINPNLLEQND